MIRKVAFELCVETIYVVEVNVNTRIRLLNECYKEVVLNVMLMRRVLVGE